MNKRKTTLLATVALSISLGTACKKKNLPQENLGPAQIHPDLFCPEGTHGEGFPPPEGTFVYCVLDGMIGMTIKQGPSIEWFANGQKKSTGDYASDKRAGTWVHWYDTGVIEKQGSYKNGIADGRWVEFHPSGMQSAEGERAEGRATGLWVYWSDGDNVRTEGHWVAGQKDGEWTDFAPDGTPLRQRVYRLGRLVNQREFQR